jgi:L-asparaginase
LLDSSNLQPEHWYRLRREIAELKDIDGVLIIHGTDTLAYTAAALSFLLAPLTVPVVITGSILPLGSENSDAIGNLQLALQALQQKRQEVVVAVGELLPGSRITKSTTLNHQAFTTPGWPAELWSQPPGDQPLALTDPHGPAASIGVLTLYPGMPEDALEELICQNHRAIIINAFGNGNAAATESFRQSLHHAHQRQIPVFVRSQYGGGGLVDFALYEAGALFAQAGAIGCGTLPFEVVLAKLQLLCAQFSDQASIIAGFQQPVAREWQS